MYNNKDTRHQTPDTRHQTPDTRHQTPDTRLSLPIGNELSKRIHSLRFILIVYVVFIHNSVISAGVNFAGGTLLFKIPFYVTKVYEFANAITCVAVPLFFLIAGFLLYSKEPKYRENLKKKTRSIAAPYMLWTVLVTGFLFTAQSFSFTKPYFANLIVRNFLPADWIGAFIGHFGIFAEIGFPLVGQFWFLRDLFVLNVLFLIIKKCVDMFPAGVFILLLFAWIGGINIYIVNTNALFFFTLGYYIVKYNINYKHLDTIKPSDMFFMYLITILTSLFFQETIPAISAVNIIVGILFFIKLSYCFITDEKIYKKLSWLEQYAFWVYATHMMVLASMIKISVKIMPMNGGWLLVHYFLITTLSIILLTGTGIIFRRLCPKIFSVLTGGR